MLMAMMMYMIVSSTIDEFQYECRRGVTKDRFRSEISAVRTTPIGAANLNNEGC
jgi:hypothetical protein